MQAFWQKFRLGLTGFCFRFASAIVYAQYIYMKRHLVFILAFILIWAQKSRAQSGTENVSISVLTCGVGDELYSSFGHTGLRVRDTVRGVDDVYNYGLFNFSDPDFYSKFTRGKLLYFVGRTNFYSFMSEYEYDRRSVIEQELNLTNEEKACILRFLNENLRPENASYKYDFLYDNCATRVRDIFPRTLGQEFSFGNTLDNNTHLSFRQMINQYLHNSHWSRLGINIVLGSNIDKVMSNTETMFLPDMLMAGLKEAKMGSRKMTKAPVRLIEGADRSAPKPNAAMWTMLAVLVATVLIFFLKALQSLRTAWSFILLFTNGALGCLLLFMWLGTDHQACNNNFNLLWAFPLNILMAFTIFGPRKWHATYSILAIILILAALLVNLTGIQGMPLKEMLPYFLAMTYAYLFVYKRAKALPQSGTTSAQ